MGVVGSRYCASAFCMCGVTMPTSGIAWLRVNTTNEEAPSQNIHPIQPGIVMTDYETLHACAFIAAYS